MDPSKDGEGEDEDENEDEDKDEKIQMETNLMYNINTESMHAKLHSEFIQSVSI